LAKIQLLVNYLKRIPWKGILAVVGTVLTGGLAADAVQGAYIGNGWFQFYGSKPPFWWVAWSIPASCSLFGLFLYKLYVHRSEFQYVRSLRQQVCGRGYKGVIFLLSSPFGKEVTVTFNDEPFGVKVGDTTLPSGDLSADIQSLDRCRWSWQQFLRGIRPHINTLEMVYLVGSSGESGSFQSLGHAANLLASYKYDVKIELHPEPVDFENFVNLQKAIMRGADLMIKGDLRIHEEDVIIDVTGGQKTTSIAGAAVTLSKSVAFQYVQTNKPNEVIEYDLEMRSPVST
jgi:hypothetical protein